MIMYSLNYEPLELYREYICIRPIFVGNVYRMEYILKSVITKDIQEQLLFD